MFFWRKAQLNTRKCGYTIVEIMAAIGTVALMSSLCVGIATRVVETSQEIKLERDVRTLNSAVSSYLAGGGSLADADTPQDVLDRLKREARSGEEFDHHDREIMFVRKSFADSRLTAPIVSAKAGRKVAVWDASANMFRIKEGEEGVRLFEVSDELAQAVKVLERRHVTFRQSKRDGWVWDYRTASASPPEEAGPEPPDFPHENTPGTPGASDPWAPPKMLQPPRFSLPPGKHALTFFPAALTVINDNPQDLSQTYLASSDNGWQPMKNEQALFIDPGANFSAYAAARNRVEWIDSPTVTAAYTAEPVGPQLVWQFPRTRYTYAQAGGEMLPGGTTQSPSPGSLELVNRAEIPVVYQNSQYFGAYWTTDGSDPLTSNTRQEAAPFTNGYRASELPITPALWGASSRIQFRAAAVARQPSYFHNRQGSTTDLDVETVSLRAPRILPAQATVKGNQEVSVELVTEHGDVPVGTRLHYAIPPETPPLIGGDEVGGMAYTVPVKAPFINGSWTIHARAYPPLNAQQWFRPSSVETRTYQICSEIPQRGEGSALALGVDLSLLGLLNVPIHIGSSSGIAPAPYHKSSGLLNVNVNAGINIPLVASVNVISLLGVAEAQVESDVKASPTASLAHASASSNLASANAGVFSLKVGSVQLLSLLGGGISLPPVLEIRARAVGSDSSIAGEPSDLSVHSFATLADASVLVNGVPLLTLPLNPPPNTGIDLSLHGLAGVTLMLNEQRVNRSPGIAEVESTALVVRITALQLAPAVPTLSGEIRIGQSRAYLRGSVCP